MMAIIGSVPSMSLLLHIRLLKFRLPLNNERRVMLYGNHIPTVRC